MNNKTYTPKQRELLRLWQNDKLKRINLLEGSVSSGKTWISLVLWAFWVATSPKDKNYLMVGKTLTSLKRNCLDLLESLVGSAYFTYSISQKQGELFGRRVYFEGVNDARAENKIRGITLMGAYCDEVTLFTEDFFAMLLSRLREPGAKMIASTNPDNPYHWLMVNYIKRADELDMLVIKFLIDDNTFLARDYVESIKKEYTGVFYDRFILGRWVTAEGAIYVDFSNNPRKYTIETEPEIMFATIGVDFGGNKSAHAFSCTGFTRNFEKIITLDEFYLKKQLNPNQLEEYFVNFVQKNKLKYKIYDAYCDSAETTLIRGLEIAAVNAHLGINVRAAKKGNIVERIRFFNSIMAKGQYQILDHCTNTIDALSHAVWKDKSIVDERLDDGNINVDSLDAMEYSVEPYIKDIQSLGVIK